MQAVLPPFPVGKKAPLQEKRSVIYWRKPTGQRGDTAVAKDFMDLLRFRSKKQQKKEMEAYAAWAFPHGPRQQEKVRALLEEDADLRRRIEAKVVEFLGMHPNEFVPTAEDIEEDKGELEPLDE